MITVSAERIQDQLSAIFSAWGMADDHVATTVRIMVETDLRGIDSHGIGMIPTYWDRKEKGWLKTQPNISTPINLPAIAVIEADRSLGHVPSKLATDLAIEKARSQGIGAVAVRNSNHFGAAGWYAMAMAEAGMIGLASTNAPTPAIVPTFGRDPVLGTNPLAFAAPAGRNPAFALDMATSTVAFGKVNIARRAGKKIPEGWAADEYGQLTTDQDVAFKARRLTPIGGTRALGSHKGYGLATMVEILCGILGGSWASEHDGYGQPIRTKTMAGHFFLAIDPNAFREKDGAFAMDMDGLIDTLRGVAPVDPAQPVMVAGDPEYAAEKVRKVSGIPLTDTLYDEVREVAAASRVAFLLGN